MNRLLSTSLCFFLALAVGCGSDSDRVTERGADPGGVTRDLDRGGDPSAPTSPEDLASAIGQAFGGDGERVETVDFRTLRDLLPDDLDGMEEIDVSGERTGMAGFSVSQAEGEYRGDDSRRIHLQIVDAGAIGQMAVVGAGWMQMEFDRESDDGYERTTQFEGYPAMEKLRGGDRPRPELQIVVAERFFVSAEGQNVDMDELKDAVREIDLDELEDMRNEGVER